MPENPFSSPQADLTFTDGAPPGLPHDGRLALASFGVRSGGKLGALLGLLGGAVLSTALLAIHAPMELGGRTSPYGVESVIVVAIAGAVLSGILGATVGSWLGGLCERRPGLLGPTANMLGGIATAIGAAAYTAIAAGLLFDSEPFNASSWPRAWIAACGAYGFVLGYVGGVISARRIAAYARWREEVSRRYGNAPA